MGSIRPVHTDPPLHLPVEPVLVRLISAAKIQNPAADVLAVAQQSVADRVVGDGLVEQPASRMCSHGGWRRLPANAASNADLTQSRRQRCGCPQGVERFDCVLPGGYPHFAAQFRIT